MTASSQLGTTRQRPSTDRAQIEASIERFIAAYNAGDIETLMSCYAEDLIKLRQGAAAETADDTRRRIRDVFARYSGVLTVRNDEIVTSGDLAFVRGSLAITLTPRAGGEPAELRRRFVELWRREGDRWLVARTMDNTE